MGKVGDNIKKRRIELGMTQDELAQKAGYSSRSTINKIENSEYDIPQSKLQKIADALDTTPAHLLDYDDDDNEINGYNLGEIVSMFKSLPRERQSDLVSYLQYLEQNSSTMNI